MPGSSLPETGQPASVAIAQGLNSGERAAICGKKVPGEAGWVMAG
jgi:hypothetical protein